MSRVSCPFGIPQNVAPGRVPWCCRRLFTALKVRHQFHRLWFLDFFKTRVLFQHSLYWWLILTPIMNYSNMIAFRMSYVVTTPALSALGYWSSSFRVGPRHRGALSNRYSLNFSCLEQDWRTFLRAHAQISEHFRRNSLAYGNLSLPAYFILFLWCLSAPYTLAPTASVRPTRPLDRPCLSWFGFDEFVDIREYYTFLPFSCSWQ
jgi:hypothetical protein